MLILQNSCRISINIFLIFLKFRYKFLKDPRRLSLDCQTACIPVKYINGHSGEADKQCRRLNLQRDSSAN